MVSSRRKFEDVTPAWKTMHSLSDKSLFARIISKCLNKSHIMTLYIQGCHGAQAYWQTNSKGSSKTAIPNLHCKKSLFISTSQLVTSIACQFNNISHHTAVLSCWKVSQFVILIHSVEILCSQWLSKLIVEHNWYDVSNYVNL